MKRIFLVISVLTIILISMILLWNISKSRTFQFFGDIYPRIETREKVVALTFDDGPTSRTGEILSILDKMKVKATFFVIGSDLEKNSVEAIKIVAEGHELGNHTYSHKRMMLKSYNFVQYEIERTDSLIRKTGYRKNILFRPPYGKKLFTLPYYLSKHNRKTILWDVEPESYPEVASSSKKITRHVLENTRPGSIILLHVMHNGNKESINSIEDIVTGLQQKGYTFKKVSELLSD